MSSQAIHVEYSLGMTLFIVKTSFKLELCDTLEFKGNKYPVTIHKRDRFSGKPENDVYEILVQNDAVLLTMHKTQTYSFSCCVKKTPNLSTTVHADKISNLIGAIGRSLEQDTLSETDSDSIPPPPPPDSPVPRQLVPGHIRRRTSTIAPTELFVPLLQELKVKIDTTGKNVSSLANCMQELVPIVDTRRLRQELRQEIMELRLAINEINDSLEPVKKSVSVCQRITQCVLSLFGLKW